MKFCIEQIAICPPDPEAAIKLLKDIGAVDWSYDEVSAQGEVHGTIATNKADLAFNYQLGRADDKPLEFEVLHYKQGGNWMEISPPRVSHLGMHCSQSDLSRWRSFFADRGIEVAQEVDTTNHTNPAIAGKRKYTYVIFDTHRILGVDLKFIVRHIIGE